MALAMGRITKAIGQITLLQQETAKLRASHAERTRKRFRENRKDAALRAVRVKWIDSTSLETMNANQIKKAMDCDGIVVPGGFGTRGVEGKIKAAQYSLKE